MNSPLKRKLLAGTTIAAVAALGGGAYAASQASNNPRQAFLNDVAKRLSVSPAQLSAAMHGAYLDQLQAAVAAGRLTQAQANAIKQRMAQHPNAPLGHFFAPGFHRGFAMHGAREGALHAAAQYLGLTDAQLFSQLVAGKSLASITTAKGKSTAKLKAAMTAAVTADLGKLRKAGMINASQEQRILGRLSTRLDRVIARSGLGPQFHPGRFGPGDGPGAGAVPGRGWGIAPEGPPPGYPGAAFRGPQSAPQLASPAY